MISGNGATLVPGLVDMHGHVYANSNPIWVGGLPDPEPNLRTYLYSGVTTVFDPGDSSGDAFERRARVARGELIGPHIYTAGPIHTAPEGHPIALVREFAPVVDRLVHRAARRGGGGFASRRRTRRSTRSRSSTPTR